MLFLNNCIQSKREQRKIRSYNDNIVFDYKRIPKKKRKEEEKV